MQQARGNAHAAQAETVSAAEYTGLRPDASSCCGRSKAGAASSASVASPASVLWSSSTSVSGSIASPCTDQPKTIVTCCKRNVPLQVMQSRATQLSTERPRSAANHVQPTCPKLRSATSARCFHSRVFFLLSFSTAANYADQKHANAGVKVIVCCVTSPQSVAVLGNKFPRFHRLLYSNVS